ncbi:MULTISPECIES: METTL5 family protein [Halolamina]|uniref:Putative methylase n=1 Tax=Halolamina pelagica TaxID=699431 RepID=A0A1I5QUR1_9EURY|nr:MULTISPECIES: METTL5 family protein [Halolamina]NHX35552.1 methyltransferase [Halolamina sp. R1-12]SFP49995.1 putative methylase [Halolamina pelagica]
MGKRALAERLHGLAGFPDPDLRLEQYLTPPDLAAHVLHLADLQGDIADKRVLDLGTGTGVLALAAACRDPARVLGLERDADALTVARENERTVVPETPVDWIRGDATRAPLAPNSVETVVMNPPFGAQSGNEGADRAFLTTAVSVAGVSYSIHNAGSREFVESFAADEGGTVTHAFAAEFDVPRLYDHHERERGTIEVEVFRIEWG